MMDYKQKIGFGISINKNNMANEKALEKKLRTEVKKLGGIALKFASPFYTGIPDRIVLLSGARIWFVELKSEGKEPTHRQEFVINELRGLGFNVLVIDTKEKLENCLKEFEDAV